MTGAVAQGAGGAPGTGGGLGVLFDDPELEQSVRARLEDIEEALRAAVRADDEFVSGVSSHLVLAGGKRFRPLVAVLAAHFGDPAGAGVTHSAVVMELTHLATLYHDDVMDEATMRRGADSANSRWGNAVAILTGDFLFSRASNLLADLGPEAVRIQARTFERLVVGQIHETVGPAPEDDAVAFHLNVVADKTGSLIAASAQLGALFAGVPDAQIAALMEFGEYIGIAFQLSDDILDITSDDPEFGKAVGTDLREGVRTLAALTVLAGDDPAEQRLRDLLSRPLPDDAEHAAALAALRASAGLAHARDRLDSYAQAARDSLHALPDVPARSALDSLCDYVVARTV
jgi:heptaprenyl diphosphate synthase